MYQCTLTLILFFCSCKPTEVPEIPMGSHCRYVSLLVDFRLLFPKSTLHCSVNLYRFAIALDLHEDVRTNLLGRKLDWGHE